MCKELKGVIIYSLDQCIEELIKYRKLGKSVFYNFNGHILKSDDITSESAYLDVIGKSKEEYEKEISEQIKINQEILKKYKENIPKLKEYWYEIGKKKLLESKFSRWKELVDISLESPFGEVPLQGALLIMDFLNENKSFEFIKDRLSKEGHTGMSAKFTLEIIEETCNEGKNLMDYIYKVND